MSDNLKDIPAPEDIQPGSPQENTADSTFYDSCGPAAMDDSEEFDVIAEDVEAEASELPPAIGTEAARLRLGGCTATGSWIMPLM